MQEPEAVAEAGLHYGTDDGDGIRRLRRGRGFVYVAPGGRSVSAATRERIRQLAIPPAWTSVWIAPDPHLHLQATGRDARGRKQYRYHARWRAMRNLAKYDHLVAFARALPAIRRRLRADLQQAPLSRDWVLATVVSILDRTVMRIGNEEYARTNGSYGLTTLRSRHVRVQGGRLTFAFRAKSGVRQNLDVHDPLLARAVRRCQELPGQLLFQYVDESGKPRSISSTDVNSYLREAAGSDITAKEFRTWAGTLAAARALSGAHLSRKVTRRKRQIVAVLDEVASQLGNTRAVCRSSYVHPAILAEYLNGHPVPMPAASTRQQAGGLEPCERALAAFLRTLRTTAHAQAA